jgi:hypothetical protein
VDGAVSGPGLPDGEPETQPESPTDSGGYGFPTRLWRALDRHRPPGLERLHRWRSPLRGVWLTSVFGSVLLVTSPIVILTGLVSYIVYAPQFGTAVPAGVGWLKLPTSDWPTRPVWLYRLSQGIHVGLGLVLIPVVLAKLTSRRAEVSMVSKLLVGFRKVYGSHPLHLLTMLAGFALLGYVVILAKPSMLWKPEGGWWQSMVVWFVAAFIAHDLVLFPIYALADRILGFWTTRRRQRRQPGGSARNFVRVPALGSGLILLIFFPGTIKQGASLYRDDTRLTQQPFLGRWLLLSAAMFGSSALVYALRLATAHRPAPTISDRALASPDG